MEFRWEDGFAISTRYEYGAMVIAGNREGLRSLAQNLLALAEEAPGSHFHLDQNNSLEDGSVELIIERI